MVLERYIRYLNAMGLSGAKGKSFKSVIFLPSLQFSEYPIVNNHFGGVHRKKMGRAFLHTRQPINADCATGRVTPKLYELLDYKHLLARWGGMRQGDSTTLPEIACGVRILFTQCYSYRIQRKDVTSFHQK